MHLQTVWESFHISDKYLAPQKKKGGVESGCRCTAMQPLKPDSVFSNGMVSNGKVNGISLVQVLWPVCFSASGVHNTACHYGINGVLLRRHIKTKERANQECKKHAYSVYFATWTH